MKKKKLTSMSTFKGAVVHQDGEFGTANNIRHIYINLDPGEKLNIGLPPMLFVIQNISSSHLAAVYLAHSSIIEQIGGSQDLLKNNLSSSTTNGVTIENRSQSNFNVSILILSLKQS